MQTAAVDESHRDEGRVGHHDVDVGRNVDVGPDEDVGHNVDVGRDVDVGHDVDVGPDEDVPWTEKFRPRCAEEVVGNSAAVRKLYR